MISFRVLLLVLVCAAVWIPSAVIVAVSQVRGNAELAKTARERTPLVSDRMRDLVDESLARAEELAAVNMRHLRSGVFSIDVDSVNGRTALRQWMEDQLLAAPSVTSDSLATTADGRMFGRYLFRDGRSGWWETSSNGTLLDVAVLANGTFGAVNSATAGFNSTTDTYFSTAMRTGVCWTDPYMWFGAPYVTFAERATLPSGETWGVFAVDVLLADAALVFQGATVKNGLAFLVSATSEKLLATTLNGSEEINILTDGQPTSIRSTSIDSKLIVDTNSFVIRQHGNWSKFASTLTASGSTSPQSIGGGAYVTFSLVKRQCLTLVVAVASKSEAAAVDFVSIGVALGATCAAVVAAAWFAFLVASPLRKLTRRMAAISELEFENAEDVVSLSPLTEFRDLDISFSRLRVGIIAMTKYIPRPVVRDLLRTRTIPSFDGGEKTGTTEKKVVPMENIANEPWSPRSQLLGMQPRHLAVMFTDIRGFTTLSEALNKRIVVDMLNGWLEAFTTVIHSNQGTVDKYIGDCIMAIWNAPDRVDNPELLACKTAIEFRGALEKLNRTFEREGNPQLSVRVGLHCGEMLIGNIGCADRINYTVCGTPANVASRLEQLGKAYECTPIVSGDVHDIVKAEYICVWLDNVILRGHKTLVTPVYHLACRRAEATPEALEAEQVMQCIQEACAGKLADDTIKERIEDAESNPSTRDKYKAVFPILRQHLLREKAPVSDSFYLLSQQQIVAQKAVAKAGREASKLSHPSTPIAPPGRFETDVDDEDRARGLM